MTFPKTLFERMAAVEAKRRETANDTREPDRPLVGDDECPKCGRTDCPQWGGECG